MPDGRKGEKSLAVRFLHPAAAYKDESIFSLFYVAICIGGIFMQKNNSIRKLTIVGIMTALSIVLTRFLVPLNTETLRFSLGNIPVILCSITCGPIYGAVCGLVSDALGCFVLGYPPYLPLSLSAILVGVLPSVLFSLAGKLGLDYKKIATVSAVMIVTNFVSSILWSTLALSWLYGTSFWVQIGPRVPVNSLRTICEIAVLYALLKSGFIERTRAYKR